MVGCGPTVVCGGVVRWVAVGPLWGVMGYGPAEWGLWWPVGDV